MKTAHYSDLKVYLLSLILFANDKKTCVLGFCIIRFAIFDSQDFTAALSVDRIIYMYRSMYMHIYSECHSGSKDYQILNIPVGRTVMILLREILLISVLY